MITEMSAYRRRTYYAVLGRLMYPAKDKEAQQAAALNVLRAISEGGEDLMQFLRLVGKRPWIIEDALTALRGMERYEENQRRYQERLAKRELTIEEQPDIVERSRLDSRRKPNASELSLRLRGLKDRQGGAGGKT